MNADEIIRILRDDYGICGADELDRKIRECGALDLSIFCRRPDKEELAS